MKAGLACVAVVLAAAAVGCGSGAENAANTASGLPRLYPWLKGPSREFLVRGGDNVVQTFGDEAASGERSRATRVISAWLRARAATDWKRDCSYFSRTYAKALTKDAHSVTDGEVTTCAQALAHFKRQASGDYVDTLSGAGEIDSLRAGVGYGGGGREVYFGYAQYHGNDGRDWVVPLEREDGIWKIAHSRPFGRNE